MTLLTVSGVARGLYSAQGLIPSARFELIERVGVLTFLWYWLIAQCRPYRVTFPLDMGIFISALGFLILPHYLWRHERWRGLLKCVVIAVGYLFAYLLSVAVHTGLALTDG
jgi:hypothetical protein